MRPTRWQTVTDLEVNFTTLAVGETSFVQNLEKNHRHVLPVMNCRQRISQVPKINIPCEPFRAHPKGLQLSAPVIIKIDT